MIGRRMHRLVLALLLGSLVAAPSQRPLPADSTQSKPTFKTGTKLVEVIVVAKDKHGPAAGLTKADFTLFDNGNRRDIAFFSIRSVRDLAGVRPSPATLLLPAGTVTNRPNGAVNAPATQTVLLLDQIFTDQPNQMFAIQRIGNFLNLRRKGDGIGIYTFGGGIHVVQDVTTDEEQLRRAARKLRPIDANHRSSDTGGMTAKEAAAYMSLNLEERVLALKHGFEAIARHLADVPGRKNLVWITQGFPLFICNDLICVNFTDDMKEAARSLNEANVALHAADARGLIGPLSGMSPIQNAEVGPMPPGQITTMMRNWATVPAGPSHIETMDLLAHLTGGDVYYNTNGIEDSFAKAVQFEDITYSLGFYPAESSQDGQVHALEVRVARPGVSLRYRTNYVALKPGFDTVSLPSLDQLLRDPLDATQIGLTAKATPDRARSGIFDVHLSIDLHSLQLYLDNGKWMGNLEVSFYLANSKSAQVMTRGIEIPEDQLALALDKGLALDHTIEAQGAIESQTKPSQLRVVVLDKATGNAGSLTIPLSR